jgi:SRSO17 transposase
MTLKQIAALGRKLVLFLALFNDCFGRKEPRALLQVYVRGQLSDLERKNVESIALHFGKAPRTLQRFVESIKWDEEKLRDRCQQLVAAEHAHPEAIGLIDESGTVKSGDGTVGVGRQWCGNRGKVENCVVSVHLAYVAPGFHCLLGSRVFLPESWANDPERRKESYVPDDIRFLTKPQIALEEIDRALGNGVRVAAWSFDELYGRSGPFLDGLERRKQVFVGEIPVDFHGWVRKPRVLHRGPKSRGRPKKYPRLARGIPSSEVRNLVRYSPVFRERSWQRYRIKDTDKGPEVWEVKWSVFWRKQDGGLPTRRHCLIAARNVLTGEEKYFVANRVPGERGVTLRWLLRVALGRWSVERCFREAKQELGLDHYQVRGWRCVHRHFYLTQLSHLFCARVRQEYDASAGPPADELTVEEAPAGGSKGRLTVEQVRGAVNAWLEAAAMTPQDRRERYETELKKIHYHQRRNEQSRRSNAKARLRKLAELHIDPDRIKSCVPKGPNRCSQPDSHLWFATIQ